MIASRHAARAILLIVLVAAVAACGNGETDLSARTLAADAIEQVSEPSPTVTATPVPSTSPATSTTQIGSVTSVATTDSTTTTTTTTTSSSTTTGPTTTIPATVERSGAAVDPTAEVSDPVAIRIPSIGVDSPLVATGVLADGTVAVPPDANIAGWFDRGPRPGERGPSLIMGHVDSARTGPGVFYELRNIEVGAVVTVDNADGSLDFVVDRVEQHSKLDFPTDEVYGPSPDSSLRLVTCGGSFDRSVRSYYDNIIVYLDPVTS